MMAPTAPPLVNASSPTMGPLAAWHAVQELTEIQLCAAIKAIHYAYPGLVLCYFVLALMVTVCTLQTQRLRVKDQHVRRDVILGLMSGVALSYVSCISKLA